jgi:hypothetical protein
MGLYELASSSGLPHFGINMVCSTFHWAVKYPVLIMQLHMDVRRTMPFLGISFNILFAIRSYTGAFLELRSFCTCFGFSLVRNLCGCVICSGSFSALLFPVWKALLCGSSFGLNVSSKCVAKVFAFSLSFRSRVLSAFLIGRMRCVGCFSSLVAFQSK